ncbi:phage terminase large subunit [Chitinophaga sp. GCM10012297]|uniref:Phage terminase large subunit n=1 Tax=Chitinophaga chungangae TaxID=2821488 RepID=A0ABS3YB68_9BACT|nr:phage terminase large subunit [Chitinophaga chungangae]MBO9151918.1 phage terminase large subunit [Chitinophaga chungangae]
MLNIYETELARRHLRDFTLITKPNFKPNWFHDKYYEVLNKFAKGEIKKLAISVPPQHGKSEGSTRRLPAFMIGRNPNLRIAIASYNATKARKFNREIQRVMDEPDYKLIFPEARLPSERDKNYVRTHDEFDIAGKEGNIKTVGVGGALTGDPVDIMIIDDIYKDQKSAWSHTVRENVQDWYDTVADSRLHNDSQVLIVFTRWHEKDLLGHLLSKEDDWVVINYPAIKKGPPTDHDPRKEGEALWPERHNKEKLEKTRLRNSHVFESLYQGDPKPREGLLYKNLKIYRELPATAKTRKAVVDTADLGKDYLCSIVYAPTVSGYYLLDVLYTTEGMEVTENKTAVQLTKWDTQRARVESNNGGRGFARNVEKICRELKNRKTAFDWYHQTDNKEVRIFTNAAEVMNMVYFPEGWDLKWPEFYSAITGYMAQGGNEFDDGPDALTMVVEAEGTEEYKIY